MKRIKTRILSFFTSLAICAMMFPLLPKATLVADASDGYYNLYINGVQVTYANYYNILGHGEASYDIDTNTLTLKKSINGSIVNSIDNLTINVTGNISINAEDTPIMSYKNLRITGNSSLKCINKGVYSVNSIFSSYSLSIENANIESGTISAERLFIKNSYVSATGDEYAIGGCGEITLENCEIKAPQRGKILNPDGSYSVFENNGYTKAKSVSISPAVTYGFSVAGIQVTENNCEDILGNRSFSYDPITKVLAVNGDLNGQIINKSNDGLIIDAQKEATIQSRTNTIYLYKSTTFTGHKKLTIKSTGTELGKETAIVFGGTDTIITMENANLDISGYRTAVNYMTGTKNASLNIIASNVSINSATVAVNGFAGGIVLSDCKVVSPETAVYNSGMFLAKANGSPATSVVIETTRTYDLLVMGRRVNNINKHDILEDGSLSYDSEKQLLSINGDCGTDPEKKIIDSSVPGLTIEADSDSLIQGYIDLHANTTITTPNKRSLRLVSAKSIENSAITVFDGTSLTLSSANIEIDGLHAISGSGNNQTNNLTIKDSNVSAKCNDSAVDQFTNIVLNGCLLKNGIINDGCIYNADGLTKANEIVIERICNHSNFTTIPKEDATCTSAGNTTYYKCNDCDKLFSDKSMTTEIAIESTIIQATGHRNSKFVEAKANSCTSQGNIAHYECIDCGRCFSDKELTKELSVDQVVIPAEHSYALVPAKESTCTSEGNIDHLYCATCGGYADPDTLTVLTKEQILTPLKEHDWNDWRTTIIDTKNNTSKQSRTCLTCGRIETRVTENAIQRLAGQGRYSTAADISKASFASSKTVVLASGLNYADALAGVPLAKILNAPILLSNKDTLPSDTLNEIKRLGAKKAIILGGEGAISNNVKTVLEEEEISTERIAGKTRFDTAIAIAQVVNEKTKATERIKRAISVSQNAYNKANTVILGYYGDSDDILKAVPLSRYVLAPILLTEKDSLSDETLNEIKRLNAKNIIILDEKSYLSDDVITELKGNKLYINRSKDYTRSGSVPHSSYEADLIAKMTSVFEETPTDVFFVYGLNYADALSVSTVAAISNSPIIYLKTNGNLDLSTSEFLSSIRGNVNSAYVIGGTGVISDNMMKQASKVLGVIPTRISGANRFETCVAVNDTFMDVLNGDSICVATGMDFPDALAGGVFAALNNSPLFLVNGKAKSISLSDSQKDYLKNKSPQNIYVFGGTGAVPDSHIRAIASASV